MGRWLIAVVVVMAGLAFSLVVPGGDSECLLYAEVICVEDAEGLSDETAAHQAVRAFVQAEYGVIAPPFSDFASDGSADHVLEVEGAATYTFTNHASNPQWSVTVEKLTSEKWRVVNHSRFTTEAESDQ